MNEATEPQIEQAPTDERIPVYTVWCDGMHGPTYDSIEGVIGDFREEMNDLAFMPIDGHSRDFKVVTSFMTRAEIDAMPEFEGY